VKPLTTNEEDELDTFVNLRLKANLRASADLQAMIDEARRRVAAKKALQAVTPVGVGVSAKP
jgi:hypothetical protein